MTQRNAIVRWSGALVTVALATIVIARLFGGAPLASTALLYIVAVLGSAVLFGRGPAVLAALVAFLCFNWFFVEPLHQLTVADPRDLFVLFVFLLAAVVTGQFVAALGSRADEARAREREATLLYEIARGLDEVDTGPALQAVAERVRTHFDLRAVAIESSGTIVAAAGDAPIVAGLARSDASRQLLGQRQDKRRRWIRIAVPYRGVGQGSRLDVSTVPLAVGERRIGAIHVAGAEMRTFEAREIRLLEALAAQVAAAIDRAALRRGSLEAELIRRSDELKTALLDAVSHDLRTPLASILASATSLRERDVEWTDAERDEFLAAIEHEARRLDRLVGHLLDASRVAAGTLRPQRAWHDPGDLVTDVVERLRPRVAEHSITTRLPDELPPVFVDYIEIDSVLTNLIENAAKFAPAGTEIEVDVGTSDGSVRFAVADHGPGLTGTVGRMFEPFVRGGSRAAPGVGLGLAIAKRLVEAHDGRIWYEARQGGGSRFVFTLPRRGEASL